MNGKEVKHIFTTSPFLDNGLSRIVAIALIALFLSSCRGAVITSGERIPIPAVQPPLPRMGYAIQVGAFSHLENAVRLTEELQERGLDSYYFLHESGLYKVRFGNFNSDYLARTDAEDLRTKGLIEEFYIVGPEDYPWVKNNLDIDKPSLRKNIVKTAESFIGTPYRLGSESPEEGFDCSGLAMTAYRFNGLELPRTSREQWEAGRSIENNALEEGDLVFFATSGSGEISHVGVYVGNGQFIHAPNKGKKIRIDSMSNTYYKHCYVGAKTYL